MCSVFLFYFFQCSVSELREVSILLLWFKRVVGQYGSVGSVGVQVLWQLASCMHSATRSCDQLVRVVCTAISCLLANLYRRLCATQAIGLTMEISMRICTQHIVSLSSVPFIAMMLQLYKERSFQFSIPVWASFEVPGHAI